jgi:hypothetical protein
MGEKLHLVLGLFSLGDIDPTLKISTIRPVLSRTGLLVQAIQARDPFRRTFSISLVGYRSGCLKSPSSGSDSPVLRMIAME